MDPRLKPEQYDAAAAFISSQVDRAESYASGKTPIQGNTLQEQQAFRANEEANKFYPEVKKIVDAANAQFPGDGNAAARDGFLRNSLNKLKADTLSAAKAGIPNKGPREIFSEVISAINPINMMGDGLAAAMSGGSPLRAAGDSFMASIKAVVKDAAMAWGGDALAPWLKAQKSNFTGKPMTQQEAALELSAQNAAAAMAKVLGIDPKANPAALAELAAGIEQQRKAGAAPAQQPGAPKKDEASIREALARGASPGSPVPAPSSPGELVPTPPPVAAPRSAATGVTGP